MPAKTPLIAAIDVGTNSFHIIIASVNHRGMLYVHSREKETVRLGSGDKDMKYLQPDAMERGVKTLKHFAEIAKMENAEIQAVATSAVREALNKDDFIDIVLNETGIELQVASGVEEARLIYIGTLYALPIAHKKTLVIDIGGGSSETLIGKEGHVEYVHSVKLGAIRQTQQFFKDNKVSAKQIDECREFIKGDWTPILKRIQECGFETVVGTAGTIQTLAAMTLAAKKQRIPDLINGITILKEDLIAVIKSISKATTLKSRSELPGIDPSRIDIILAGALILEYAINFLNIESITISSYSLREGIIYDTVQKKHDIKAYKQLAHQRLETVYNICSMYKVDMKHVEHIKALSLSIFDDLQKLHKLGNNERELLEAAALLHDVGYHISFDQHHKHSYYIISNCMMPGFNNIESEIIALIARYHRKSHPKKKHLEFQHIASDKRKVVCILAGILRIAEGLDRRQIQNVSMINSRIDNNIISLILKSESADSNMDIELWGANRRKALLEESLSCKIEFIT